MAEKVASLYAEIGANTTGLKAGLDQAKAAMSTAATGLGNLASTAQSTTRAVDTHFDNMADSITANLNSSKSAFDRFSTTVKSGATSAANFSSGTMKALSAAGKAWSDLATPLNQSLEILGKVGRAAQQAYQYISEGTQLATTAHQFDALSKSIGTTAAALLGDLKTATRGTISDAQLMASATSIMSLGLADTSEETVRLASLVGKLGWDMNQVTLTIANQSKMRLDSLGLSVRDAEERVDALKASGLSADQAFKFAILEAGEAKVRLLGDAADTTAGKLKIMEANAANFGNSFKMAFSEELIQNINAVAGGVFESEQNAASLGETLGKFATNFSFMGFIRAAKDGIEGLGDESRSTEGRISGMGGVVEQLPPALNSAATSIGRLTQESKITREAVIAATTATDGWIASLNTVTTMTPQAIQQLHQQAAAIYQETSPAYAELQDKISQTNTEYDMNAQVVRAANLANSQYGDTISTVTGAVYASTEAIAAYTAATGDYATMAIQAGDEGVDLNQVMYDSLDAAGGSAEALVGLALATGQLTEAQAENILKQAAMIEFAKGLGEQIAAGSISINDAVTALSNFEAGLESSNALINTATGSVILMDESLVGAGSAVGSLQTNLDSFTAEGAISATQAFIDRLNSIPRTVDVQVNVHGGEGVTAHGGYQNPDAGGEVGGGNVPQYAEGGSFVVPPGFPAGRPGMQIGVHSGEEVNITPAGQQSQGGNTYNLYVTAMDGGANVSREFNYMKALSGV